MSSTGGFRLLTLALWAGFCCLAIGSAGGETVKFERLDDRVSVSVDGKPFTEYLFDCFGRPVLYPVIGPHGIAMTRHFPIRTDVPGEAHDHEIERIWKQYAK